MYGSCLSCLLQCDSRSLSMWPLLVQRNRFSQKAAVEAAKETHHTVFAYQLLIQLNWTTKFHSYISYVKS